MILAANCTLCTVRRRMSWPPDEVQRLHVEEYHTEHGCPCCGVAWTCCAPEPTGHTGSLHRRCLPCLVKPLGLTAPGVEL